MPSNKTVKIGGVTFNKADVKLSKVIKKDGKTINSVFLKDGTHIEFPNQAADNRSRVDQLNASSGSSDFTYEYGYNWESGEYEQHWTTHSRKDDPTEKITLFKRMRGAKITGTEKRDDYRLFGCCDTTVDLSQNDGKIDYVSDSSDVTGSLFNLTKWSHDNNTIILGKSDNATRTNKKNNN